MSQENVEIVRDGLDAVNRRDAEAFVRDADPEIEFHAYFSEVLGGTFKRHSGMRAYISEIAETFEEFVIEFDDIEDRGDLAVAQLRAHGRGMSGVAVRWHAVVAVRFRNGKVWRIATRPTETEALEAVGLLE
ncbi:MAG: hypothetical protein QOG62_670 [Thermoleophilaceae bacterium]|jgi:ketosteroid isomerase-like protein|nr:hypothetical protein [Thermoleophilaceae bacterium]